MYFGGERDNDTFEERFVNDYYLEDMNLGEGGMDCPQICHFKYCNLLKVKLGNSAYCIKIKVKQGSGLAGKPASLA